MRLKGTGVVIFPVVLILFWMPFDRSAFANNLANKQTNNNAGIEIGELVINETHTRFGQEFYEHFSTLWQSTERGITIAIRERVNVFEFLITVSVNENAVYVARLTPRSLAIEEEAQQAVTEARRFIERRLDALKELEMY